MLDINFVDLNGTDIKKKSQQVTYDTYEYKQ